MPLPFVDPTLLDHLDEQRNFNQLVAAFMEQVPSFATPEGLAALRSNDGFFATPPVDHAEVGEIPGPGGPIPTRTIRPLTRGVRAVHLYLHGGGWCIGSAASNDAAAVALAEAAGVAVVSIDYRLAPEHPFPAGPDDCEAAALWLIDQAHDEFGTEVLTIGGASAGAHLAALTLLRLRDGHGAEAVGRFRLADLLFGAYDLGLTPSARDSHELLVIPRTMLDACMAHALPGLDPEARRDPQWSPLYARLDGLPPALLTVGTLDPLLDDSLFLYQRWAAAGSPAELHVYPDGVHGFPAFPTEMGRISRERMLDWYCRTLDSVLSR